MVNDTDARVTWTCPNNPYGGNVHFVSSNGDPDNGTLIADRDYTGYGSGELIQSWCPGCAYALQVCPRNAAGAFTPIELCDSADFTGELEDCVTDLPDDCPPRNVALFATYEGEPLFQCKAYALPDPNFSDGQEPDPCEITINRSKQVHFNEIDGVSLYTLSAEFWKKEVAGSLVYWTRIGGGSDFVTPGAILSIGAIGENAGADLVAISFIARGECTYDSLDWYFYRI